MKYLTLIPDYTGSCLQEEFEGEIAAEDLNLPEEFMRELNNWHLAYRKIIPLSAEQRIALEENIEELDKQGINLAEKLEALIKGGAKVKYFSEGKLKYIPINLIYGSL